MADLPGHSIKESIGHEDRGTTVVTAGELDVHGEESAMPLAQTIAYLQSVLDKIPAEFRGSAVLRITAYGDYASATSDITYQRPETDAELADRRRWLNGIDQENEARDRREFERLRQKFNSRT